VQGGLADIWKENVLEELEEGVVEYKSIGELLMALKKEFGGGVEEAVKVAELKKLEQGGKTMEAENQPSLIEQWFRRATALDWSWRESRKEEERLRGKKEQGGGAPKQEQRQIFP